MLFSWMEVLLLGFSFPSYNALFETLLCITDDAQVVKREMINLLMVFEWNSL